MQKRLYFDVTELSSFDKGTGIQRVTRAVLLALRKHPPLGWDIVAVRGDSASGFFRRAVAIEAILGDQASVVMSDHRIVPDVGDIFLSVDLAYNITTELRQELARFRSGGVEVYFVIYDLIPIRYPQWFLGNNDWFEGNKYLDLFNSWFDCVATEANGLICISESVEHDVRNWLLQHPPARNELPKLGHFHLGSDIGASIPSAGLPSDASALLAKLQLSTSFLMVGTLEPRKGHALALDAFERLWDGGNVASLVIVGRAGWKVDELIQRIKMHAQLGKQLFWLDGISDEYLREVYRSSSALLALSEAEGFGLPLVESAYFQIPVIARDIPVFREICGDGALYYDGSNGAELMLLLKRWMKMRQSGEHPIPCEIKTLSWAESTRRMMDALGKMSGNDFVWAAK
jgi:glycosyltransferase involved in cell wall biosynthesis